MSKARRSAKPGTFQVFRPLCLTGLVAAFVFASALQAAEASRSRSFNLPADVAKSSLTKFAEQSGLEVVFATDTTGKVRTNAVKGEYTSREAMHRLLSGTGLVATENSKTGALLVVQDPNEKHGRERREPSVQAVQKKKT